MLILNTHYRKIQTIVEKYHKQISNSKVNCDHAVKTSLEDLHNQIFNLIKTNNDANRLILFFTLVRDIVGSGAWILNSHLKLLKSIKTLPNFNKIIQNPEHQFIINKIANKEALDLKKYKPDTLFNFIFNDLMADHGDAHYHSKLKCPQSKTTIVIVSGVLNELYKLAPFERGIIEISDNQKIKYFVPKVSGTKSCDHNAQVLYQQLQNFIENNPNDKIWFLAYSKGGLDCLHFLRHYGQFSKRYVIGLSTIATPVLGSYHTENRILKTLNNLSKIKKSKAYSTFLKDKDLFFSDFRKSLSNQYQRQWFLENHRKLPKNIFYTSIALNSSWYESHFWMVLAKIVFKSEMTNDGIVDVKDARFPSYFPSYHLGDLEGHHLVAFRSSSFNQKAFIMSHLILLNYLGMLP